MAYTPGKGTDLQLSIASVYTSIAQVVSVTPPQMEVGASETTHLLSEWREYIATIPDGGELTFNIEWDAAASTHGTLFSKFKDGESGEWKVILNDAGDTVVAFAGCITNFSPSELTVDNVSMAALTVKVSGEVTITP